MNILSIKIPDSQTDFDSISLINAEWWEETPQFVLVKYSFNGSEQNQRLRIDMDKKAIMDDIEDPNIVKIIKDNSYNIWILISNLQQQFFMDLRLLP